MENDKEHPKVLIEEWFPFQEVGIESRRERGSSSALPPVNYLHVWWARRPLIASKAAILASILPSTYPRKEFLNLMKFDANLIDSFKKTEKAKKEGKRIKNPYRKERAFKINLQEKEENKLKETLYDFWKKDILLLDPMSGGGAIPFEGHRLGLNFISSEINPVAVIIQNATFKYPLLLGLLFKDKLINVFNNFEIKIASKIKSFYSSFNGEKTQTYLFVRTIRCSNPSCNLIVPLSPNWDLIKKGKKKAIIKLIIPEKKDKCSFSIIFNPKPKTLKTIVGTVKKGIGICPRCKTSLTSDYIKEEAQNGRLGHQIMVVAYLEIKGKNKIRKYREVNDDDLEKYEKCVLELKSRWKEWEEKNLIPTERFPRGCDNRPIYYGMEKWFKFFNPRQLYSHLIYLNELNNLKKELKNSKSYSMDEQIALITYLQFVLDKILDRNSIQTRWVPSYQRIANTFDRHDFAFKWSYAEMDIVTKGLRWALNNVIKAYSELCLLLNHRKKQISIEKADVKDLRSIEDKSVDVIVVDPPYYNNVMYSELSDFFYVWMKRSLADLYPNIFSSELTDKDNEVVANYSRFEGMGGSKTKLAKQDYESKMELSFKEMYRVLQKNGVLTIMFTHKSTDAWDTLAMSLMEAGFEITASWPVHTESDTSLHIAKKNAVKTTILLVCRKRIEGGEELWWEDDILPAIKKKVLKKAKKFRNLGIEGVDLFISCFGPALKEFSKSYPVKSISGEQIRAEQAIETARKVVIEITLQDIIKGKSYNIDPVSKFYLTAWHFFKARIFPFDEARRLALSIGINIDDLKKNYKLLNKKSGDVSFILPKEREKIGAISVDNPKDNGILINAVHIAILAFEEGGQKLYDNVVEKLRRNTDKSFRLYMETLFNVLPDVKDLAKNLPEKKILGEILMTTEEKITPKGGKITDYTKN
ncbi:MAG: DUF1156 domain-containing protein [Promethearchaeota archaeon]